MNLKTITKVLFRFWLMFCVISTPVWAIPSSEVILICHPDLRSENFSSQNLINAYAMKKRVWSDNTPVRVFSYPNDSQTHKEFVKDFLHMQAYQLDRLWYRLKFSGTGKVPEELDSAERMIQTILNTPGAIGYLPVEAVKGLDKQIKMVMPHE